MSDKSSLDRFFKLNVGFLACVTLGWVLLKVADFLIGIVVLFGMSLLFTYLLLAPVNVLETLLKKIGCKILYSEKFGLFKQADHLKCKLPPVLPRILSIVMVYMVFALIMLLVSFKFIPIAYDQLSQFSNELPKYINQAEEWILNQPLAQNYFQTEISTLKSRGEISQPEEKLIEEETHTSTKEAKKLSPTEKQVIRKKILGTSDRLVDFVKEHIGGAFQNLFTVISTTLTGFVYALTGLMLVFYFLLDGKDLKDGFIGMLPREAQESTDYLLSNIHLALFGFVKGQVMLGIATGIYMVIIYSIFDIPYSFFLGAFFALAEIIPVVGTWLGFLPGILVILFIDPVKLLFIMGCVYVYQLIKDNLVAPRVLGHAVGLHPVMVILSILICAKVAGLIGVLFAIPLASIVNVLISFAQQKENKRFNV